MRPTSTATGRPIRPPPSTTSITPARRQQALEQLDAVGVGAEVDDVVEGLAAGSRVGSRRRRRSSAPPASDGRPERRRLGVVGHDRRHRGGRRAGERAAPRPSIACPASATTRSRPPGAQRRALARARTTPRRRPTARGARRPSRSAPRRRGSGTARPSPGSMIIRSSRSDVLLEPALEVVAEGGVRAGRRQVPVVGLDEDPLADRVARDGRPDGDDPARRPRGRGRSAARPARSSGSPRAPPASRPPETSALRRCVVKACSSLVSEKQMPDRLDPEHELRRARARAPAWPGCGRAARARRTGSRAGSPAAPAAGASVVHLVVLVAGGDGSVGTACAPVAAQLSITWPPVTGRAWPVSYCWATR